MTSPAHLHGTFCSLPLKPINNVTGAITPHFVPSSCPQLATRRRDDARTWALPVCAVSERSAAVQEETVERKN